MRNLFRFAPMALLLLAFDARAEDQLGATGSLIRDMHAVGRANANLPGSCLPARTRAAFRARTPECQHRLACQTMAERLKTARAVLQTPSCSALFARAKAHQVARYRQTPLYFFDQLDSGGVCADNPNLSAADNLNQTFENSVSKVFISQSCGGGLANGTGTGSNGKLCITAENFLFGVSHNFDEQTGVYWSQVQLILHEFGHILDAVYNESTEGSSVDNQALIGWHCIHESGDASARAAYKGAAVPLRP